MKSQKYLFFIVIGLFIFILGMTWLISLSSPIIPQIPPKTINYQIQMEKTKKYKVIKTIIYSPTEIKIDTIPINNVKSTLNYE